jgi:hypothetical protein
VIATIQNHLPPNTPPLRRRQVWLMDPPPAPITAPTWEIICLAALSAMEHGRKSLTHLSRSLTAEASDPTFNPTSDRAIAAVALVRVYRCLCC